MIQHFTSERFGKATFLDRREAVCSVKCQPRDIQIVSGEDCNALREEIAIDVCIGQGYRAIGLARGMKHA